MTAGYMADRECHGQYGKAKSQCDPQQSNTNVGESRSEYCAATAAKNQPEGAYQLGC